MQVTINGWDCQMSVREFAELAAMMKAPKEAPELPTNDNNDIGGLRSLTALKMQSGEYLYFHYLGDIQSHFPELGRGYNALGGFSAPTPEEYVRKQARKLYNRLKPENRFTELVRYTTGGKCITATAKDGGRRFAIEVTEVA